MRRLIIAIVAGGLLSAAVYGAAASLGTLTGQNIAATDSAVVSCDPNGFDIGYNTMLDLTASPGVQRVTAVRIDSGLDPTCENKQFRVRLTSDPDGPGPAASVEVAEATLVTGAQPFTFPLMFSTFNVPNSNPVVPLPFNPLVSAIDDIHITQES